MSNTANPRINVTLGEGEYQVIKEYATAVKTSLSNALLNLALEKLEDYEDMLLAEKAIKRLKKNRDTKRFTMEDFERAFDELPE